MFPININNTRSGEHMKMDEHLQQLVPKQAYRCMFILWTGAGLRCALYYKGYLSHVTFIIQWHVVKWRDKKCKSVFWRSAIVV